MVDCGETLLEGLFDCLHILETERRFAKEPVGNLAVDQVIDEMVDILLRIIFEAA